MRQDRVDGGPVAGDGSVDPLARQKKRAAHPAGKAQVQKRLAQRRGILEAGKVI